eukprot:916052-Prymnesium_polylepis.2
MGSAKGAQARRRGTAEECGVAAQRVAARLALKGDHEGVDDEEDGDGDAHEVPVVPAPARLRRHACHQTVLAVVVVRAVEGAEDVHHDRKVEQRERGEGDA